MPAINQTNAQLLRCDKLLKDYRRDHPTVSFRKAVKAVCLQLKKLFAEGFEELLKALVEDGVSAEAAAECVRKLLDRGALDVARVMKYFSSRRPTAKDLHVFSTVFFLELGATFRIFDLDSRRVLDVAQLAAHFKTEEIENVVRKENAKKTAAEKLAAEILAHESEAARIVARAGVHDIVLPRLCRKSIAEDKEIVDARTFHCGMLVDPTVVNELNDKLCAKLRTGKKEDIQYAKECAESVKWPPVYIALNECAEEMMKKLPEDLAKELKADAMGKDNVSAHKLLSEWPKSTSEAFRAEWNQATVQKPCTSAKTLKLTDAFSGGRWDATAQYDINSYAIDIINTAHLVQNSFVAKIRELRLLCEALCEAKLKFGPVKELKRVREKILELEGALHPKSGTVIDLVRCSLEVDGCDNIVKVVEFLLQETAPRDSDADPLKAGEVRLRFIRVKNGFEGWLSDERPPHYRDVKINVSIKCKVGGSVRTLIGEVQVFGQGMGAFKDKSHGFYSVTRTADAWQMVEDMLANFSFAELRDSASMKLLTDAGFRETDKEKRQMAFEVVAVRSSVPLTVFEDVCGWYDADKRNTALSKKKTAATKKKTTIAASKKVKTKAAKKKKSTSAVAMKRKPFCDVSEDFLHRVVARRADRNDFAETLDFLQKRMTAVGKWQSALARTVGSRAPVAWYIEEAHDVSFKRHIAAKLWPSPLPPAGSSWPMKEFTDINILHVAAVASARFGASPARVQYCIEKMPAPKPPRIGSLATAPVDSYTRHGGLNPVIEAILRATVSEPMPACQ